MAVPETAARRRVQEIFNEEFEDEGFVLADDKLLRASGKDGAAEAAVSTDQATERPNNVQILQVFVRVQLYLAFDPAPDEHLVVDPTIIEGYADRLRRAFQEQSSGNTADLWYLRLQRVEYPDDPTGNKTRFEAFVLAESNNPAGI